MLDSHDNDWLYDIDSHYNELKRKELEDWFKGEDDYQRSKEEW